MPMIVTIGDGGVLERVEEEHLALAHALGLRRADIVLLSTSSMVARVMRAISAI